MKEIRKSKRIWWFWIQVGVIFCGLKTSNLAAILEAVWGRLGEVVWFLLGLWYWHLSTVQKNIYMLEVRKQFKRLSQKLQASASAWTVLKSKDAKARQKAVIHRLYTLSSKIFSKFDLALDFCRLFPTVHFHLLSNSYVLVMLMSKWDISILSDHRRKLSAQ